MQEISFNLLKKKLRKYPHLNEIQNFITRIDKENLKLILLYGSLTKGTFTQHSDIDVLCVYDKEFKDRKERFLISYKYSDGLVQPKNLSYKEFKNGLIEGNSFLHSIMEDANILYRTISKKKIEEWINQGKKKLTMQYYPPS